MVAQIIDIWNQALSECGARATVASTGESSKEAQVCNIHYNNLRTSVLRSAPWGCASFEALLTKVEDYSLASPTNQYPWLYGFTYPSTCLQMRYILEAPLDANGNPVATGASYWAQGPNRNNRFIPALTPAGTGRVLLTNVTNAIGVYTYDLTDVTLWDQGLWDAVVAALCAKIVIPLTGNIQMKGTFEQLAMASIREARAQDANESKPTTDHVPDWISTRGAPGFFPSSSDEWGYWYTPYTNLSWGE